MEWISVRSKQKPKEFEQYLVWNARNHKGFEIQIQGCINGKFTQGVTHWLPLPEAPKINRKGYGAAYAD